MNINQNILKGWKKTIFMTKRIVLIFGISLTVIFIFGIFIGLSSPVQELKSLDTQLSNNMPNTQSEDKEFITNLSNQINIINQSELSEKKIKLIDFIWN